MDKTSSSHARSADSSVQWSLCLSLLLSGACTFFAFCSPSSVRLGTCQARAPACHLQPLGAPRGCFALRFQSRDVALGAAGPQALETATSKGIPCFLCTLCYLCCAPRWRAGSCSG